MKSPDELDDISDEQLEQAFARVAGPLLARVRELEAAQQRKGFEIMILRNAYENMVNELDEYKEKMKRLPRGLLTSEVLQALHYDCRIREGAAETGYTEIRSS